MAAVKFRIFLMGKTTLPIDVDCHVFLPLLLFIFVHVLSGRRNLIFFLFISFAGFSLLEQCQTFIMQPGMVNNTQTP
jgi:hypothetical protein